MKNKNSKELLNPSDIDTNKTTSIIQNIIDECMLNEHLIKSGLWHKHICDMSEQDYCSYKMFLSVMKDALHNKE